MINIIHLFTYFCGDSIENSSISENNQSCYISNNLSFQKLFAHVNLSNKYFLWINCLKCKRNVLKPTWMSGSHISDKKFVEAIKCPEGPQPVELLLIKILKKVSGLSTILSSCCIHLVSSQRKSMYNSNVIVKALSSILETSKIYVSTWTWRERFDIIGGIKSWKV